MHTRFALPTYLFGQFNFNFGRFYSGLKSYLYLRGIPIRIPTPLKCAARWGFPPPPLDILQRHALRHALPLKLNPIPRIIKQCVLVERRRRGGWRGGKLSTLETPLRRWRTYTCILFYGEHEREGGRGSGPLCVHTIRTAYN